jgi:hypothetical protein
MPVHNDLYRAWRVRSWVKLRLLDGREIEGRIDRLNGTLTVVVAATTGEVELLQRDIRYVVVR